MEIEKNKKQYFVNLLKKDAAANLTKRIDYYQTNYSDIFQKKVGFAPIVYRNYWVVIPINFEDFAFSVGMDYNYNLPDVMVISDTLSQKEFQILTNEINCYARDKGKLELGRDYTNEIIIKKEFNLEINPEDIGKPEGERRVLASNGEEFKLVDIDKPLIFKEYTLPIEIDFPCGYLYNFNHYFADKETVNLIVADLR